MCVSVCVRAALVIIIPHFLHMVSQLYNFSKVSLSRECMWKYIDNEEGSTIHLHMYYVCLQLNVCLLVYLKSYFPRIKYIHSMW